MPGGNISGCQGCNGQCCFAYVVPVCGYDVYAIATRLLLSIEQFVAVLVENEPTPTGFHLDLEKETYTLALDKQAPQGPGRPCTFLVTLPDGHRRCGIYAHRPLVCQTYPTKLHHGAVTVRDDIACPRDAWSISGMDLPAWRASLLRMDMEWAIYAIVVEQWNAVVSTSLSSAPRNPEDYFAYLMTVYRALEAVRPTMATGNVHDATDLWASAPTSQGADPPPWRAMLAHAQAVVAETLPTPTSEPA